MNERIRELADQAGADFMSRINYNNLEGEEYEEDAGVIFESNESFEKFAELIVRECLAIARHREDELEDAGLLKASNTAGIVAYRIARQFGVKE